MLKKKNIDLCFAIDQQHTKPLWITLFSILENTECTLNVFIFNNGLEEDIYISVIREQLCKRGGVLTLLDPIADHNTHLPEKTPHKTKVARLKFDLGIIDKPRILYLDTDLLVRGDIEKLFNLEMSGHILAAAPDINNKVFNKNLGLVNKHIYFNSGVLLVDLNLWRNSNISEKLHKTQKDNQEKFSYVDQDAFNVVFDGKYKQMNLRWNFPYNPRLVKHSLPRYIYAYRKACSMYESMSSYFSPKIVHFIGVPKPDTHGLVTGIYKEFGNLCLVAEKITMETHNKMNTISK